MEVCIFLDQKETAQVENGDEDRLDWLDQLVQRIGAQEGYPPRIIGKDEDGKLYDVCILDRRMWGPKLN